MRQSHLVLYFPRSLFLILLHFYLARLSLFRSLPLYLPFSLWKSGRADASSYQSAESVNRQNNVFQPAPSLLLLHYYYTTTTTIVAILVIHFLFPVCRLDVAPSTSGTVIPLASHLYGPGLPSSPCCALMDRERGIGGMEGRSKFNGDRRVKPISDYFFQFNRIPL